MRGSALLEGKVILVTGAARGIGRACAEACVAQGATVLVNARDTDRATLAAAEISAAFPAGRALPVVFDVRDGAAVRTAFAAVHKEHRRLDALINNAGILRDALVAMVNDALLDEVMSINFTGTFYCAQMASRLMARQNSGSIINLSSIIGREGNIGQSVYAASKAAVLGLTYSLAKELGPNNIRVNAIAPGFIDTDMITAVPDERRQQIIDGIRMKRLGTAQDVAGAAVFLASDLSTYVTGQVLGVDGGMTI